MYEDYRIGRPPTNRIPRSNHLSTHSAQLVTHRSGLISDTMSTTRHRLRLWGGCGQDGPHPSLTTSPAVALTLRAVGGLTTRQIAEAYLVPQATMAQRISRAKRTLSGVRFDSPGHVGTVLRVLYLVFNEGYSGELDLAPRRSGSPGN
jgi:predicted RNA polymerase sigma factor